MPSQAKPLPRVATPLPGLARARLAMPRIGPCHYKPDQAMSRILDALESSDKANTIIGRAMGRVPHDVKSNDLDIIIAIAAVLASVTATMAAVANLMVVVLEAGGQ